MDNEILQEFMDEDKIQEIGENLNEKFWEFIEDYISRAGNQGNFRIEENDDGSYKLYDGDEVICEKVPIPTIEELRKSNVISNLEKDSTYRIVSSSNGVLTVFKDEQLAFVAFTEKPSNDKVDDFLNKIDTAINSTISVGPVDVGIGDVAKGVKNYLEVNIQGELDSLISSVILLRRRWVCWKVHRLLFCG